MSDIMSTKQRNGDVVEVFRYTPIVWFTTAAPLAWWLFLLPLGGLRSPVLVLLKLIMLPFAIALALRLSRMAIEMSGSGLIVRNEFRTHQWQWHEVEGFELNTAWWPLQCRVRLVPPYRDCSCFKSFAWPNKSKAQFQRFADTLNERAASWARS